MTENDWFFERFSPMNDNQARAEALGNIPWPRLTEEEKYTVWSAYAEKYAEQQWYVDFFTYCGLLDRLVEQGIDI